MSQGYKDFLAKFTKFWTQWVEIFSEWDGVLFSIFKVHIFWESHKIFTLLLSFLSYIVPVKSKLEILQNFVAFSEYTNFKNSKSTTYFSAASDEETNEQNGEN